MGQDMFWYPALSVNWHEIFFWTDTHFISFLSRYILGKQRLVIFTEQSLLLRMFDEICKAYRRCMVDLFATCRNRKLTIFISLIPDNFRLKRGCIPASVGPPKDIHISSICPLEKILNKVMTSEGLSMVLVARLWPQKVFSDFLFSAGDRAPITFSVLEPAGSASYTWIPSGARFD